MKINDNEINLFQSFYIYKKRLFFFSFTPSRKFQLWAKCGLTIKIKKSVVIFFSNNYAFKT